MIRHGPLADAQGVVIGVFNDAALGTRRMYDEDRDGEYRQGGGEEALRDHDGIDVRAVVPRSLDRIVQKTVIWPESGSQSP